MQKMIVAAVTFILTLTSAYAKPEDRQALFGETHVHSALSFDSYIFGNRNSPDDAYRYAKGEAIKHPYGFDMKLRVPLDFQAVTDHAMYLGMIPAMFDPESEVADHKISVDLRAAKTPGQRLLAFQQMFPYIGGIVEDDLLNMDIVRSAWQEIIDSAVRHYEPGEFTTFIGYEYTSSQNQFENLHRNVIFNGAKAPREPFSRLVSRNPEDLWRWMDEQRAQGMDSIAIPHNSNGSDGFMFRTVSFEGNPLDEAYSTLRMRNEPIVEISQVKGTSETHPLLSPNDEFADFEIMPYQIASWRTSRPEGSYIRSAYLEGLKLQAAGKGNPFKFGLIAASDTHVGAGAFDEYDFWSKVGILDATGKQRGAVELNWKERIQGVIRNIFIWYHALDDDPRMSPGTPSANPAPGFEYSYRNQWGASGLAGVWAEENTREAIFAALRRKETFATSGPRMKVRFFASYDYDSALLEKADMVRRAYAQGVPMGGDLLRQSGGEPVFLAWALRDSGSAPLQRIQIVKGWLDAQGDAHEKIYDIVCAGGVAVDPTTQRCPDNNAQVNLEDCSYSADSGADELKTLWRDPEFDAMQSAFYYIRVLENPTCRWSTWDAIRAGSKRNPSMAATLQERAWSSPIWYEN